MKLFKTLTMVALIGSLNSCGQLEELADKAETALNKATEETETDETSEFETATEPVTFSLMDFQGDYHEEFAEVTITIEDDVMDLFHATPEEILNVEFNIENKYPSSVTIDEVTYSSDAIMNVEDNMIIHWYVNGNGERAIQVYDIENEIAHNHIYLEL